jgi:hypothetical protein
MNAGCWKETGWGKSAISLRRELIMKKAISTFGLVALLFAAIGLSAMHTTRAADAQTWTGWISDSHCGAKGMSAGHKACAQTCVKTNGASWVFVNGADKKVLTIENQDAVNGDKDLGQEVKVTGHVTDKGALHVDSIVKSS